jgi:hypothetical protein
MAKPWKKRKRWPHVAKSGAKTYFVGFYDHDGAERTRSFPAARLARGWIDGYIAAERRGRESLRQPGMRLGWLRSRRSASIVPLRRVRCVTR